MTLICAPTATLSHEAFRRTVEQFGGCSEYFTEMINAASLVNMGPWEKFYLLNGPCPEKIVWQLTGSRADSLEKAASIVAERGGIGVDINMGCSAPQIYKTGAGIAWMLKSPGETREAVRSVKKALDTNESKTGRHMRLSVKCRLGDEDFTEKTFFSFTDMLVEEGVELLTLHPRTIKEKYRTLPRYEWVEALSLRYQAKIPVMLNGAVSGKPSLDHALSKAPHSSGVMIARAAAQKPWIFSELSGTLEHDIDAMQTALGFIDNVEQYQPEEFHKTRIQRFFSYYCQNFRFGHYFATQMNNYHSLEESRKKVMDYFERSPEDRFIKAARGD